MCCCRCCRLLCQNSSASRGPTPAVVVAESCMIAVALTAAALKEASEGALELLPAPEGFASWPIACICLSTVA